LTVFKAVQDTFEITGPLPSTNLILAVCIKELTPTTSKTPECCSLLTRSPRLGAVITLDSVIFASRHRTFDRTIDRSVFLGISGVKLRVEGKRLKVASGWNQALALALALAYSLRRSAHRFFIVSEMRITFGSTLSF
jgi:hypothetical protein